ncbi:MAG: GNAT family N-acetyltransferase [Chloroflexi bacterium]|nr:GNAT family N-acetyltransferase [Chloroflexota bacterium]
MEPTVIETARLVIRPFIPTDLPTIHRILDQTFGDGSKVTDPEALAERQSWLQWTILNQQWFPALHQPPYGERAIVLKNGRELVGAIGYVPCMAPFAQIPGLGTASAPSPYNTPEAGLFWTIDPPHQQRGYATEAAQGMLDHAFMQLGWKRMIATTEYDNLASQSVMRKLGMRLERNPFPEPAWLQIVGILENTRLTT